MEVSPIQSIHLKGGDLYGFKTYGVLGGIIATLALILPSFIFVVAISKVLKTFKDNFWVKYTNEQ